MVELLETCGAIVLVTVTLFSTVSGMLFLHDICMDYVEEKLNERRKK